MNPPGTSSYWFSSAALLTFSSPPRSSRNNAARERSEKTLISAPSSSRPGPFVRGGSAKELLETQNPEELRREREGAEPRRPSVAEDKTEPERSKVREPGKNTGVFLT